ncbi:MAG: PGF-pre-PGF domain-containing protein [Methanosarcinales archaeon]|nr:PGF-pre-PGF domain-containing protein [Methanosarcinales archaeon]
MSNIMRFVALVLLSIFFIGSSCAEWNLPIYVTSLPSTDNDISPPPPPATYICVLGVSINATDEFDKDLDVSAPPPPPADALDVYFPCSHEVVNRLATDIKPDLKGVSWTMELIVPSACVVRMDWNVEAVPENIPVIMNTGTTQINMKSQDYTTFETGMYSLKISTQIAQNSNGGSSGGGGGSGGSGEAFENILISETEREYVNKGSVVSYNFDFEGNVVQYLNFTGLKNSGKIAAKVEILNNTSTLVDSAPLDIVYKNLNIWVGNLDWATSENIDNPIINFKVEKSWVIDNKISKSTISLNRYSDGKWNPLETYRIGEDADYLYFEAKVPGFSPFAVTGKKAVGESGGEGIIVEPTETAEKKPVQAPTEKKGIPGFSLFAGVLVLLIVMQILRKNN